MKKIFIILTIFICHQSFAQFKFDVIPSISYIQSGEVTLFNQTRLSGDVYGTRLNLSLEGSYSFYRVGFRASHFSFGTRDLYNGASSNNIDGKTFEGRVIHPYIGLKYMNILASIGFYIEELGDITDSDNASYEINEGLYLSLGYQIKDYAIISIEFENTEGYGSYYNASFGYDFYQDLDIENTIAVNLAFPINLF